jgi:hypothetical protein
VTSLSEWSKNDVNTNIDVSSPLQSSACVARAQRFIPKLFPSNFMDVPKRLFAHHTKSADAGSGAHRQCFGSRVDLLNETKGETREYRKCFESTIMSFQDLLV